MTAPPGDVPRGRTRITTRALTRLIARVTADALAVAADQVTVGLTDAAGRLSVHVRAPIGIGALTGPSTGATVLERAERAQKHIRHETARLTGTDVVRVVVQVTGALIRSTPRRPQRAPRAEGRRVL
ncbi:hypothetical protein D6T64_16835 [Cryobacterium melibiosiphilum]|uniref:Asp23/Gls24 family envelope stress response protein n=1 Tax=Cryobacterium melibiosiphilum TaxID=995039 RepID=A0A3A5MLZ0_9MICO|nr:hypothetical protein [Cryobacterium melibiosiphilum]RJT87096.1 hypothetical protein D6T64_16835 [Cryobacterium melibiosiphilum]